MHLSRHVSLIHCQRLSWYVITCILLTSQAFILDDGCSGDSPCNNHGKCNAGIFSHNCECYPEWEGPNCEIRKSSTTISTNSSTHSYYTGPCVDQDACRSDILLNISCQETEHLATLCPVRCKLCVPSTVQTVSVIQQPITTAPHTVATSTIHIAPINCFEDSVCESVTMDLCNVSLIIQQTCPVSCKKCTPFTQTPTTIATGMFTGHCVESDNCATVTEEICRTNHMVNQVCPITCKQCSLPVTGQSTTVTTTTTTTTTTLQGSCIDGSGCSSPDVLSNICSDPSLAPLCPAACGICKNTLATTESISTTTMQLSTAYTGPCVDSSACVNIMTEMCVDDLVKDSCPITCKLCSPTTTSMSSIETTAHTTIQFTGPCVDGAMCTNITAKMCTHNLVSHVCPVTCNLCVPCVENDICANFTFDMCNNYLIAQVCPVMCKLCNMTTTAPPTTTATNQPQTPSTTILAVTTQDNNTCVDREGCVNVTTDLCSTYLVLQACPLKCGLCSPSSSPTTIQPLNTGPCVDNTACAGFTYDMCTNYLIKEICPVTCRTCRPSTCVDGPGCTGPDVVSSVCSDQDLASLCPVSCGLCGPQTSQSSPWLPVTTQASTLHAFTGSCIESVGCSDSAMAKVTCSDPNLASICPITCNLCKPEA